MCRSSLEAASAWASIPTLAACLHSTDRHSHSAAFTHVARAACALPALPDPAAAAASPPSQPRDAEPREAALRALTRLALLNLAMVQREQPLLDADAAAAMRQLLGSSAGAPAAAAPAQSPEAVVAAALGVLASQLPAGAGDAAAALAAAGPAPRVLATALAAPGAAAQAPGGGGRLTFAASASASQQQVPSRAAAAARCGAALPCLAELLAALRSAPAAGPALRRAAGRWSEALARRAVAALRRAVEHGDGDEEEEEDEEDEEEEMGGLVATLQALPALLLGGPAVSDATATGGSGGEGQQLGPRSWTEAAALLHALASRGTLDGAVRGHAALALARLSSPAGRLAELQASPASAVVAGGGAPGGVTALSAVTALLCDMAAGRAGLAEGPGCAAGRVGAAVGLAVLLAGPAAEEALALPGGAAEAGGLLAGGALSSSPHLVRPIVRTLDALVKSAAAAPQAKGALGAADAAAAAALALALAHRALDAAGAAEGDGDDGGGGGGGGAEAASAAGGDGGAAALQPLSRYPEQGPLRRCTAYLAEAAVRLRALTASGGAAGAAAQQEAWRVLAGAAAALACLARAPRLARHDYGAPVASVLELVDALLQARLAPPPGGSAAVPGGLATGGAEGALAEQAAAVAHGAAWLALAHAPQAATGLAPLLSSLLAPARLLALPAAARGALLRSLPRALACLAPSRAAQLVVELADALAHALDTSTSTSSSPAPHPDAAAAHGGGGAAWEAVEAMEVARCAWFGLAGVLASPPPQQQQQQQQRLHADVVAGAAKAVAVLLEALPPLGGTLTLGDVARLRATALEGPPGERCDALLFLLFAIQHAHLPHVHCEERRTDRVPGPAARLAGGASGAGEAGGGGVVAVGVMVGLDGQVLGADPDELPLPSSCAACTLSNALDPLQPLQLPASLSTAGASVAGGGEGRGPGGALKQRQREAHLGLWAAAAHALLRCGARERLPAALLDDAALRRAAPPHGREGGAPPAAAEARQLLRSCQMRALLAACGGGAARVGEAELTPARAWLSAQRWGEGEGGGSGGVVELGLPAAALLLGQALAATSSVPQQVRSALQGRSESSWAATSAATEDFPCRACCGSQARLVTAGALAQASGTGTRLLATATAGAALAAHSRSPVAAAEAALCGALAVLPDSRNDPAACLPFLLPRHAGLPRTYRPLLALRCVSYEESACVSALRVPVAGCWRRRQRGPRSWTAWWSGCWTQRRPTPRYSRARAAQARLTKRPRSGCWRRCWRCGRC